MREILTEKPMLITPADFTFGRLCPYLLSWVREAKGCGELAGGKDKLDLISKISGSVGIQQDRNSAVQLPPVLPSRSSFVVSTWLSCTSKKPHTPRKWCVKMEEDNIDLTCYPQTTVFSVKLHFQCLLCWCHLELTTDSFPFESLEDLRTWKCDPFALLRFNNPQSRQFSFIDIGNNCLRCW